MSSSARFSEHALALFRHRLPEAACGTMGTEQHHVAWAILSPHAPVSAFIAIQYGEPPSRVAGEIGLLVRGAHPGSTEKLRSADSDPGKGARAGCRLPLQHWRPDAPGWRDPAPGSAEWDETLGRLCDELLAEVDAFRGRFGPAIEALAQRPRGR